MIATPNNALQRTAAGRRPLQSARLVAAVAELGSLDPNTITIPPGAYAAVVAGAGGMTGLGFVQFYSLAEPIRELNPATIIKRRR